MPLYDNFKFMIVLLFIAILDIVFSPFMFPYWTKGSVTIM